MFAKRSYLDAGATGWLLALATLTAGAAAAQDAYVSNAGQGGAIGQNISSTQSHAQEFTTGSESGGYALGSIGLTFNENVSNTGELTVTINSEDSDGNPGTVVATLTKPSSLTSGTEELFFAPSNTTLSADTSYFVTVEASGAFFSVVWMTTSNAEDSGGSTGWSIHDKRHFRSGSTGTWGESSNNNKVRISVYPPRSLPWDTTMTVGSNGRLGYNSLSGFGSLDDDSIVHNRTEYQVRQLDVNSSEVRFRLGPNPGTSSGWVLEWAGEELPLNSATRTQTFGSNRVYYWEATWLTNNASSLDSSNYQTTVTSGSDLAVCVRLSTQTCSGDSDVSTDATLSDLELQDTSDDSDIALSPTFATTTLSYTAMVANDVDEILVDPTTNDDSATVEFLDADDNAITDAHADAGHQVDLNVGDNTIKVKVTAEDTMATQTYEIVVTRAASITTFVSNLNLSAGSNNTPLTLAQLFTAGSSAELDSVDISFGSIASGTTIDVAIHSVNSSGHPGGKQFDLTSPSSLASNAVNTFTAPADKTLAANTSYAVVIDPSQAIEYHRNTNNSEGTAEAGWSINNSYHENRSNIWTPHLSQSLLIAVKGIKGPTSNDATLSDLDLSWDDSGTETDIALTPTFATGTTSYTAMVANGVDEILVDPTTNDDGATVEFLDADDMAIADANAADGHQVALAEGDNTIKVKVTAEDTTSEETYTLVVTRALEVSVLVSNTGRSHDDTSDVAGTAMGVTSRLAQGFTTGDNLGGYALDRVRIALDAITGSENALVSIYSNSGGSPDSLLHTLVSPTSYPPLDEFYEFDAPATATLDASTTYHIVIEASSGNFFIGFTAADGEDPAGEDDWSLADSRQRSDDGAAWASHAESLRVRVFGSERTPSTDATLSDLELHNAGDDSAIGAFPDFAPEVTSYSAWVRTDGAQITATPSLNDDGATVEYLNANDLAIDDANTLKDGQQINLAEGFNTIKVKVTAEDTLTTETYTFLITRLAPILVHNLGQVGEDFTPTDTPAQAFTTGPNPGGYEIAQVWVNTQNQGTAFSASIWTTNANAEPDTLLYSLTAPDSFVGFAIFFGAPVDARLDPSTTYSLVLDTPASGLELRITRQNGESAESASGWSIRDTAHFESSGSWADDPHGDSLHIGLAGRELAASTDATLSDLALQDTSDDSAIALTPTFASDVTSYTVSVANDVDEILVDPTVNDSNATVAFLDADDMAITDADGMEDGHQVALAVGANTIKVKITAEDTTSVATYTVVVTRAAATDVLVSNFDENNDAAGQVGGASNRRLALKFTVGPDSSYTVTDIRLNHTSEASGVRVAIHEGSSTNPGTLLYDMDAPTSTSAGNRTHSAPSGAVLAASTSYFVVVRGDTSLSQRSIFDDGFGQRDRGDGVEHRRCQA